MTTTASDRQPQHRGEPSLIRLLYLYLWPMWMFRDVSSGSALERAAAYRHNRSFRKYLPGYAGKWLAIAATTLAAIRLVEFVEAGGFGCSLACAVLGLWLAWAVIVAVVLMAAWIFMETVPG